ncbi:MAG: hypothetical protein MMC33_007646 [Icmadophila ericetorum]|nr:hypothetical protein [Icmadophila ericetorum]
MGLIDTSVLSGYFSPSSLPELKSLLNGSEILVPESKGYAESIKRWSDAAEKKAGAVVQVTTPEDIAAVVLFCQKHSVSFTVSGGKHSTNGSSSSTGGVVIDLVKMNRVTVDPEAKIATVQGGAVWADVDAALAEHGLAAVGGTVNHTGVGGLTLGGGYGWLSGRHGLTIDNLLSCTMVLADGRTVKASETEYPDLFWGIRGAGHCLGVAVEFVFRAHEQVNKIWAGQLIFPEPMLVEVINFANQTIEKTTGDQGIIVTITCPPPLKGALALICTVFFNGPESAAKDFFGPLLALGPLINTTAEVPYKIVNSLMNVPLAFGGRKLVKGGSFLTPISPDFVRDTCITSLKELHTVHPNTTQTALVYEFYPSKIISAVPTDAMAFVNRSGHHQSVVIGPMWGSNEALDSVCRKWAQDLAGKFERELSSQRMKRGIDKEEYITEYGNYDGMPGKANTRRIFGKNFDKLVGVKKEYDPKNVFSKAYDFSI